MRPRSRGRQDSPCRARSVGDRPHGRWERTQETCSLGDDRLPFAGRARSRRTGPSHSTGRLNPGATRFHLVFPGDETMKAQLKYRPDLRARVLEDRLVPAGSNLGLGTIVLTTGGFVLTSAFPGVAIPASFVMTGPAGISGMQPGNGTGAPGQAATSPNESNRGGRRDDRRRLGSQRRRRLDHLSGRAQHRRQRRPPCRAPRRPRVEGSVCCLASRPGLSGRRLDGGGRTTGRAGRGRGARRSAADSAPE